MRCASTCASAATSRCPSSSKRSSRRCERRTCRYAKAKGGPLAEQVLDASEVVDGVDVLGSPEVVAEYENGVERSTTGDRDPFPRLPTEAHGVSADAAVARSHDLSGAAPPRRHD